VWTNRAQEMIDRKKSGRRGQQRVFCVSPPDHAKSSYWSIAFPLYYIGQFPEDAVAIVSNTDDLAQKFMGSVAATIKENEKYQKVFPHVVPDPGRRWNLKELYMKRQRPERPDPSIQAIGLGGGIIGRRLDCIIVDDPINEKFADSEADMARVKRWFKRTLLSRLKPNGIIIVIMTRWALDDLGSDILDPTMRFELMHMKAWMDNDSKDVYWFSNDAEGETLVPKGLIHSDGPGLWPERWPATHDDPDVETLEYRREEVGAFIWASMYQGEPVSGEHTVFSADNFRYYCAICGAKGDSTRICPCPPATEADIAHWADTQRLRRYQAVDPAFTEKTRADYTAIVTGGVDDAQNIFLMWCERSQTAHPGNVIVREYERWSPVYAIAIEQAGWQTDLIDQIRNQTLLPLKPITPDADKRTRALPHAINYENHKVYHPKRASWLAAFEREHVGFTGARNAPGHDDQVDANVYLGKLISTHQRKLRGRAAHFIRSTVRSTAGIR
jgi:predicted phage terminase large subunit-like protein